MLVSTSHPIISLWYWRLEDPTEQVQGQPRLHKSFSDKVTTTPKTVFLNKLIFQGHATHAYVVGKAIEYPVRSPKKEREEAARVMKPKALHTGVCLEVSAV